MKKRQTELDILRILAIIGTIIMHIKISAGKTELTQIEETLYNGIWASVTWCVPIFVMISGRFFLDPAQHISTRIIWRKYIRRLLTAFAFWSGIYQIYYYCTGTNMLNWKGIITQYFIGAYHMWFIYMIIFLYAITPVLRKISDDLAILKYIIIIFLIAEFLTEYGVFLPGIGYLIKEITRMLSLNTVTGMVGYYLLGWYLYRDNIQKKHEFMIYILGIVSLLFTIYATSNIPIPAGQDNEFFYKYLKINVIFESIALYVLFIKRISKLAFQEKWEKRFLLLSKNSFGVYLIHALIIELIDYSWLERMACPYATVPLLALLIFSISMLVTYILKKITIIRVYLM